MVTTVDADLALTAKLVSPEVVVVVLPFLISRRWADVASVNLVDLMSFPRPFLTETKSAEVIWWFVIPFPHILNRVTVQGPVVSVTVSASKGWSESIQVAP